MEETAQRRSDGRSSQRGIAGIRIAVLPALLLVLAALAVYGRALGHQFLVNWDDPEYVIANETIRGLTLDHLCHAFTAVHFSNYAPLHLVSYMVDYELWGLNPAGFIFANIAIHAGNALLLFLLLGRITGRRILAFLSALLFLVHPVQVESVVWVAERKNVLALFFFLLAFWCYIRFREREGGKGYYISAVAAFVAALLTKAVAVVFPAVLLPYDTCFGRERRPRPWALVPFVISAALFSLLSLWTHAPEFNGGRTGFHGGSPWATFLTMLPVMASYLRMLVIPAGLSAVYEPTVRTAVDLPVAGAFLLLAVLFLAGLRLFRRRTDLFFWGAVYWIALLPVAQIVPLTTLMNDRYLYFPLVGAAPFAVFAAAAAAERFRLPRGACLAGGGAVLLLLALASFDRAGVWRDAVTLWTDAVGKVPESRTAAYALGGAYTQAGRLKTASDCFTLGEAFARAGLPDKARSAFERGLFYDPQHRDLLYGLVTICLEAGDTAAAAPLVQRLRQAHPGYPPGMAAEGEYLLLAGRAGEAEKIVGRAVKLDPRCVHALRVEGDIAFTRLSVAAAAASYRRALAVAPTDAGILFRLSSVEAVGGRNGASLDTLEKSLRGGFTDRSQLERHPLRDHPRFRRLVDRYLKP